MKVRVPNRTIEQQQLVLFGLVWFVLITDKKRFGFEYESECISKLFTGCSAVLVILVMGEAH